MAVHWMPPTDYSPAEILKLAADAIDRHGGPDRACVFFKWRCEGCRAICTFDAPNALFERGTCACCGHVTTITTAGFSLGTPEAE